MRCHKPSQVLEKNRGILNRRARPVINTLNMCLAQQIHSNINIISWNLESCIALSQMKCSKEEFKPCIHAGFGKIQMFQFIHTRQHRPTSTYHLPYLACLGDKSANVFLDPEGELDGLPGDGLQARASTKWYANFL